MNLELDKEIAWLRCQLLRAKKDVEDRSTELEDSDNPHRWRELEGMDPEPEQLEAKVRHLQSALDAKQVPCTTRSKTSAEMNS